MRGDLSIALPLLYGFALTLARISGIFVFLPLPGRDSGAPMARIVLALACTMALAPKWPEATALGSAGTFIWWMLAEAVMGVLIGLAVGFITDALVLGAQVLSMPAGYGYASTFDPNTNADSGILQIFAQLLAGLMFFATGLDRQIIHAFALSLDTVPPGSFVATPAMIPEIIRLGASMFTLALRLAIPIVALLLIVDLSLGILGRLNAQMQIVTLSFPAKMLVSILLLAATLGAVPRLFSEQSAKTMEAVAGFIRLL